MDNGGWINVNDILDWGVFYDNRLRLEDIEDIVEND